MTISATLILVFVISLLSAALASCLAAYYIIKQQRKAELARQEVEIRAGASKQVLPIKLQALERLTILMERMAPNNIILRVKKQGMEAFDLKLALLTEIRSEFDHNVSQQIYVNSDTWSIISAAKENLIKVINVAYSSLPEGSSALDLSRAIFELVNSEGSISTPQALNSIREEMHRII